MESMMITYQLYLKDAQRGVEEASTPEYRSYYKGQVVAYENAIHQLAKLMAARITKGEN